MATPDFWESIAVAEHTLKMEKEKEGAKKSRNDLERKRLEVSRAELKVDEIKVKVQEANLKVKDAQCKFEEAKLKLEETKLKFEEAKLEVGKTEREVEDAELKFEEAELKVAETQCRVKQAIRKVDETKDNLEKAQTNVHWAKNDVKKGLLNINTDQFLIINSTTSKIDLRQACQEDEKSQSDTIAELKATVSVLDIVDLWQRKNGESTPLEYIRDIIIPKIELLDNDCELTMEILNKCIEQHLYVLFYIIICTIDITKNNVHGKIYDGLLRLMEQEGNEYVSYFFLKLLDDSFMLIEEKIYRKESFRALALFYSFKTCIDETRRLVHSGNLAFKGLFERYSI
jgi:hypothetical protein